MSHTLETAIAFPLVLSGILLLISAGPVFYKETADAAAFQVSAILQSNDNRSIYLKSSIIYEDLSYEIVSTSPERMHFLVRAIEDSGKILIEGVTSP